MQIMNLLYKRNLMKNLMKIVLSWIFGSKSQRGTDFFNLPHVIRQYFHQ